MTAPSNALNWRWCHFEALSVYELDAIYRARQQVFAVEQNCPFVDADGLDPCSWHLAAWAGPPDVPQAYARVVSPGHKYAEPSIGRVITSAGVRGTGLGRTLMRRAIEACTQTFRGQGIRISAQSRLERFYAEFGFKVIGTPYGEDGIPHIEMLLSS